MAAPDSTTTPEATLEAVTRLLASAADPTDLHAILTSIAREASLIHDADVAAVYRGSPGEALTIDAAHGLPSSVVGYVLPAGDGLAGRVALGRCPLLINDYQQEIGPAAGSPFTQIGSAMAVPMVWDGELLGVLAVGFHARGRATRAALRLLASFGELAAIACRNATAHAGALRVARTDGLTGCLNHSALMDALGREIERCSRTGDVLSVALLDLDDFKAVNERDGHLAGDEVLRRVGHALRLATRPYDLVARYGGDEFAVVAIGTDEAGALALAGRTLDRIRVALDDLPDGTRASAGVATWRHGQDAATLLHAADVALMHAKNHGLRGRAMPVSELPAGPPLPAARALPARAEVPQHDRLERRTRQLAMANTLGTRLAAMTDVQAICDATVDELHRAFDFFLTAVIRIRPDDRVEAAAVRGLPFEQLGARHWSQPRDEGIIGRCLRERAVVLVRDVRDEPGYKDTDETQDVRAEVVAPIFVGDELWGAVNCEELEVGAFDEDDARLVRTVADQVGSALRSALLYERLERAYLGTAEALAAALEAKDSYTAHHADSIVRWALAVGRRLGLDDAALRDLRYGAIFHDIGKIAVPEAILHKNGPLDEAERRIVERHPIVGAQILQPIEFLASVLPLVRHEHERWDGAGYPDGLRGEDIPLGARIVLACDAFHAMTSDRPYRAAMSNDDACAELRRHAGTQFDPVVVAHLLDVLEVDLEPVEAA